MIKMVFVLPNNIEMDFDIKKEGPSVCVVALTENNNVVISKQFRPGPEQVFLELPCGGLEENETPLQAMERELLEETGYAGDIKFIGICSDCAYSIMERHYFIARNCKKIQEPKPDETEFIDVEEISLKEFRDLLRSGKMTDFEVGYLCLDHLGLLK